MGNVINALNNRIAAQGQINKIAAAKQVLLTKKASNEKLAAAASEIKTFLTKQSIGLSEIMPFLKQNPVAHEAANAGLMGLGGAGLGAAGAGVTGGDVGSGAAGGFAAGAGGYGAAKGVGHLIGQSQRIANALRRVTDQAGALGRGVAPASLPEISTGERALGNVGQAGAAMRGFDPAAHAVSGAQAVGAGAVKAKDKVVETAGKARKAVGEAAEGVGKKIKGEEKPAEKAAE